METAPCERRKGLPVFRGWGRIRVNALDYNRCRTPEVARIGSKLRIFIGNHGKGPADRQILTHTSVNLAEPGEERVYALARPSSDIG